MKHARTLAHLLDTACGLGDDELAVLVLIAERIAAGRGIYGELDIDTDRRNFAGECLEEVADGLVYVASALIRAVRRGATGRRSGRRGRGWNACSRATAGR